MNIRWVLPWQCLDLRLAADAARDKAPRDVPNLLHKLHALSPLHGNDQPCTAVLRNVHCGTAAALRFAQCIEEFNSRSFGAPRNQMICTAARSIAQAFLISASLLPVYHPRLPVYGVCDGLQLIILTNYCYSVFPSDAFRESKPGNATGLSCHLGKPAEILGPA